MPNITDFATNGAERLRRVVDYFKSAEGRKAVAAEMDRQVAWEERLSNWYLYGRRTPPPPPYVNPLIVTPNGYPPPVSA